MKKILITAAIISLSLLVTACYVTTPKTPPRLPATPITNQADCTGAEGKWEKVGFLQNFTCVLATKDAGNSCTDSSQCEERCLAIADPKDTNKTIGQCQATNQPFGCFAEMENGSPGAALCID